MSISDTHPSIEKLRLQTLRKTSAARKAEMWGQMFETMKSLSLAGLRQRHPEASPTELQRRLADLLLGPTLAEKAYGSFEQRNALD